MKDNFQNRHGADFAITFHSFPTDQKTFRLLGYQQFDRKEPIFDYTLTNLFVPQ